MQPRKSLGQHWLFDEASLEAMLRAGQVSEKDVVLEVGPGLGTLTKKLAQKAKTVVAVELDDELAKNLKHNLHDVSSSGLTRGSSKQLDYPIDSDNDNFPNLQVLHQSILDFDVSGMPKGYKVIANIPYYLTSNLIRKLLESPNVPFKIVLLIQKEVAERIVATPGSMSILSVSVQFYAEAKLHEEVPAALFTPPPQVDSQIISITPRTQPLFPDVDTKDFFKVVRAGFSEKRKKLRSSLSGGLGISKTQADELLAKAHISADARAQELEIKDWYLLAKNAIL